jgi:hypothetical protein
VIGLAALQEFTTLAIAKSTADYAATGRAVKRDDLRVIRRKQPADVRLDDRSAQFDVVVTLIGPDGRAGDMRELMLSRIVIDARLGRPVGLDPTFVSPAAKSPPSAKACLDHPQSPSKRLPAIRV